MQNLSIASGGNELFNDDGQPMGSGALQHRHDTVHPGLTRERERQLVGSLTSAYAFKPHGLIKRVHEPPSDRIASLMDRRYP